MASFVTEGQLQSPATHNESKDSADPDGTVADGETIYRKKKLGVRLKSVSSGGGFLRPHRCLETTGLGLKSPKQEIQANHKHEEKQIQVNER